MALVALFAAKRVGDGFVERTLRAPPAATPVRLEAEPPEVCEGYTIHRFSFEGVPGERVPVLGVVPGGTGKRHPAIIFLYGIGMKTGFSHEIAKTVTDAGCALFVPEQYGRGQRKVARRALPLEVLQIRRRLALTILETRRLAGILSDRPDIDPDRICLWGVSLGAMTAFPVTAHDRRIAGGIFTAAAGDLPRIALDSAYLRRPDGKLWERGAALIAAEVLRPFDPIRHVDRIAPRPVLFQNASRDEIFPRSAVEALYDAAGEPKEIHWFDSPHDRPERATVEALIRDGIEWLRASGMAALP
jgi:dienelactone hydrolase